MHRLGEGRRIIYGGVAELTDAIKTLWIIE